MVLMKLMMLLMNITSISIVWYGAKGVDVGTIQVGDILAYIQYTMHIIMSFLMISMISIMLPRASVSAKRIIEVISINVFAIYIKALTTPQMSPVFLILMIASPIYAGYLGIQYRKKECNNRLNFINSWALMIIIHLCAAVLSAIACYVYFQYMDNGLALSAFKEQIDTYQTMEIGEEMKKAFNMEYSKLLIIYNCTLIFRKILIYMLFNRALF